MPSSTSRPSSDPRPRPTAPAFRHGPLLALAVLFSMNLLNYVDRYVFSSLGREIEAALRINHADFGWLAGAFMLVYTFVSPVMGWLGDRYNRRRLLALGVGLWSLATIGTAFARTFGEMFLWRALLGVGEASYGIIAPALLADLFAPAHRGRVMGVFYLALPLGGALGYGVGGFVGSHWGWRQAFWVVGLPGLMAAVAALLIPDPGRGASEGELSSSRADRPGFGDYARLFRTPSFLFNIAGMAAVTFVTGAYGNFAAIFYQEVRGLPLKAASYWIGGSSALSGLIGIALGTGMAELLRRFTRRADLLWAGVAILAAIPFVLAGILLPDPGPSLAFLSVGLVLMASVLGPSNTVTANVVPASRRAAGYALSIFLIHLFGDISSPILIGTLADRLGRPEVVDSPLGRSLAALGALPVDSHAGPTNLTASLLLVAPILGLGALFFLLGSRHLPTDQEHARRRRTEGESKPAG